MDTEKQDGDTPRSVSSSGLVVLLLPLAVGLGFLVEAVLHQQTGYFRQF